MGILADANPIQIVIIAAAFFCLQSSR